MIIRKPQITDTLLYPEFFDALMRQKDIQSFKYKLSDHNYSGSNYCNYEGFYNQNVILEQYETLFNMPVLEWVRQTDMPSEISVKPDSSSIHIKYYERTIESSSERNFYINLQNEYDSSIKNINNFDFSEKYYNSINNEMQADLKPKVYESGVNQKSKYNISVENSKEYIVTMSGDNKEFKFELIQNKGYKKYKITNSSGAELGELTLK